MILYCTITITITVTFTITVTVTIAILYYATLYYAMLLLTNGGTTTRREGQNLTKTAQFRYALSGEHSFVTEPFVLLALWRRVPVTSGFRASGFCAWFSIALVRIS